MSEVTEATNPEAEELEEVAEGQEAQGDDQPEVNADSPEEGEQPDDDLDEIDVDGQKYRVPKAVIPKIMKDADYTRKTQETAERGRALDAREAALAQQAEASKALIAEHANVHALKQQLATYKAITPEQWQEVFNEDPGRGNALRAQYDQLKDLVSEAESELSTKETSRLQEQQAELAKQMEEAGKVLSRDIPGWSPELVNKLAKTASDVGVGLDELRTIADPRLWKVLHKAHLYDEHQAKQKKAQTITKQAAVTPAVSTRGGSFSGAGIHDKLPTEEWVRRRNAEEAKKRRA